MIEKRLGRFYFGFDPFVCVLPFCLAVNIADGNIELDILCFDIGFQYKSHRAHAEIPPFGHFLMGFLRSLFNMEPVEPDDVVEGEVLSGKQSERYLEQETEDK